MTPTDAFLTHWYFHVPNLIMAALIYSLIARYVLELFFAKQQDAVILRVFRGVTTPVVKLVRWVTPAIVPDGVVIIFAIVWLMGGRLAWFLTCVAAGMRPSIGG